MVRFDAAWAGRGAGQERSSTWWAQEEEIRWAGGGKQAGKKQEKKDEKKQEVRHGQRCFEDWRAMVVLGLTMATCFQESVGGRLLPRWLLTAAAAQVCPALLLPLSDSPKISQPILSSCITLCSPQAAIKNVLFNFI